jgi:excisionase family DNA binding protein
VSKRFSRVLSNLLEGNGPGGDAMPRSDRKSLVVSVPEAALLLGISRTHAYALVTRGELVHVRLGRRIVVPKHAIDALLDVAARVGSAS